MQFVTFNIRTEAMADGVNRFFYRKGLILDEIEKRRPDIIGFQEMKHDMNSFMREHLSRMGYTMVGGGRGADYMGEHNPVAFDSSKYELLGLDTSWLSDTPYVPGSRYEKQSSCPRQSSSSLSATAISVSFCFDTLSLSHLMSFVTATPSLI